MNSASVPRAHLAAIGEKKVPDKIDAERLEENALHCI
jgi:hypothetical protein